MKRYQWLPDGKWFSAVFITLLMCLTFFSGVVQADSASATDTSGFDTVSSSGVTDSTSIYRSSPKSVSLIDGEGKFRMNDFREIVVEFYVFYDDYGQELDVFVTNKDDSQDWVRVRIRCSSAGTVKVTVKDEYQGESKTESENLGISNPRDEWLFGSITIRDTSSKLDGTALEICAKVAGNTAVEMNLQSSELKDVEARRWNEIVFKSPSADDTIYIDDIKIETNDVRVGNLTAVILAIAVPVAIYMVVAWKCNLPPLKKQGVVRKKVMKR